MLSLVLQCEPLIWSALCFLTLTLHAVRKMDVSAVTDSCFDENASLFHKIPHVLSWFATHMFNSLHICMTSLSHSAWPLDLFSLISPHHHIQSDCESPLETHHLDPMTFTTRAKQLLHWKQEKTSHSHPNPLLILPLPFLPPPLSLGQSFGQGGGGHSASCNNTSPPTPHPSFLQTLSYKHAGAAHFHCLLSLPN